jgi:hypothetical protein
MKAFNTSVGGIVRDESGAPVPGAIVYIVSGTGSWPDIAGLTNESGEFRLGGMEPGRYLLSVRHEKFGSTLQDVEIQATPLRVDFTLREGEGK